MDRYTGTWTALNRLEHEHMVTIACLHIISISSFNRGLDSPTFSYRSREKAPRKRERKALADGPQGHAWLHRGAHDGDVTMNMVSEPSWPRTACSAPTAAASDVQAPVSF